MIYHVNKFSINKETFEISHMGEAIACEPKVFDLIVYLIENNSRLVGREELFEKIWHNREISDTTLSNHIKIARKIFGDDGQSQEVIKTVRGRGYQFVAPIKQDTIQSTNKKANRKPWILKSILLTIMVLLLIKGFFHFNDQQTIEQESYLVAVLPLSNTKPSPQTDYLGLAIADRVISELAYFENINVRSSISTRQYNQIHLDYQQIGRELNVDYILTGTYLSIDNAVRLNIELVRVKNNDLVWRSKQIEVANQDIFQLQDIVARQVLKGLKLKLPIATNKNITKDKPTNSVAYNLYLKSIAQPFSTEGHQQAIAMLKQSIELDEQYAPAYVELGNRIRRLEQFSLINTGQSHDTLMYYQKALSLNDSLLSALAHLAFVYTESNRIDEAMELAQRMLIINPKNAQTRFTLGYIYRYAGLIDNAIEEMLKAIELDPKNIRFRSIVATYSGMNKIEDASKMLKAYPKSSFKIGWQGLLKLRSNNMEEAVKYFDEIIASDQDSLWGLVSTIHKAYITKDLENGLIAVHKLEQTNIADSETVFYIGIYYCMLGDDKRCLHSLKKAVDGGYYNYPYMDKNPYLGKIRNHPDFLALYNKAKQKSDRFKDKYL